MKRRQKIRDRVREQRETLWCGTMMTLRCVNCRSELELTSITPDLTTDETVFVYGCDECQSTFALSKKLGRPVSGDHLATLIFSRPKGTELKCDHQNDAPRTLSIFT